MNRPVYDSKGGNKSRVILLLVLAVILIVAAIYFFVLSGAEHEGVQVTISEQQEDWAVVRCLQRKDRIC